MTDTRKFREAGKTGDTRGPGDTREPGDIRGPGVAAARRILLGTTMIVAPAILLLGHLLTVPADEPMPALIRDISAKPTLYVLSTILIAFGVLLIPLSFVGMVRFAPARGGALVTIGAALATIGAIGAGAGNAMFGMVLGSLLPAHPDLATQVIRIAGDAPAATWEWQLFYLFPIGMVLVAIGLILARRLPVWMPIVLGAGTLLLLVSGAGGLLTFLLLLPLGVGLAAPGVVLLTGSPAGRDASVPDGHDES
jgi:MFS family permease